MRREPQQPGDGDAVRAMVGRRNLHEELATRIRSSILEGTHAPGERISEQQVAERFGVSRTPVREALKLLAAEGLVTLRPARGARVRELSVGELSEVFPIIGALEALAGELACLGIAEGEVRIIEDLHNEMVSYYRAGRLDDYFLANQAIHAGILAAARNRTLSEQHRMLAGRIRLARCRSNHTPGRWAEAVAEHEAMLEALKARDGIRLGRILKEHLDHKLTAVIEGLG